MGQTRISKPRASRPERRMGTEVHDDSRTQRERQRGQSERAALGRELDDLLDDIDDVLEENAQEFVEAFVQKGGE